MAGLAPEAAQFDVRQYDAKMSDLWVSSLQTNNLFILCNVFTVSLIFIIITFICYIFDWFV